jgi:hypothetical protein
MGVPLYFVPDPAKIEFKISLIMKDFCGLI